MENVVWRDPCGDIKLLEKDGRRYLQVGPVKEYVTVTERRQLAKALLEGLSEEDGSDWQTRFQQASIERAEEGVEIWRDDEYGHTRLVRDPSDEDEYILLIHNSGQLLTVTLDKEELSEFVKKVSVEIDEGVTEASPAGQHLIWHDDFLPHTAIYRTLTGYEISLGYLGDEKTTMPLSQAEVKSMTKALVNELI